MWNPVCENVDLDGGINMETKFKINDVVDVTRKEKNTFWGRYVITKVFNSGKIRELICVDDNTDIIFGSTVEEFNTLNYVSTYKEYLIQQIEEDLSVLNKGMLKKWKWNEEEESFEGFLSGGSFSRFSIGFRFYKVPWGITLPTMEKVIKLAKIIREKKWGK